MTHHFFEHYALLDLKPGAGWRDLKAAYRKQIRTWHPDRFHSDATARKQAEEKTKAINRAYSELTDYYRAHAAMPLSVAATATATTKTPTDETPLSYPHTESSNPYLRHRYISGIRYLALGITLAGTAWFVASAILVDEPATTEINHAPLAHPPSVSPAPLTNNFFTYGSTMGEVYAAQGVPSSTESDVWHYGTSKVYFSKGAVIRWEDSPDFPLKTRAETESPSLRRLTKFSKGSTKSEVRSIQGNPMRETDRMWDYGVSRVYFEGDLVVDWYESPLDPLKVKH